MNKIKISLILIFVLFFPLAVFAQVDFNFNLPDLNIPGINVDDLLTGSAEENINLNSFKFSWSAETYTPYEYKGRALPVQGAAVIIEAILDISGGNPTNLKYSWFVDDVFQENKSGYAKTSFEFRIRRSSGATHKILVKIFNESRSFSIEESIEIPIAEPEIVLCFSNGGSYFSDRMTRTADVFSDKKAYFIVRPYFFDINKLTDLNFEWRFANQDPILSSAYSANVLDLLIGGKTNKDVSETNLSVSATNKSDSRQSRSQSALVKIH